LENLERVATKRVAALFIVLGDLDILAQWFLGVFHTDAVARSISHSTMLLLSFLFLFVFFVRFVVKNLSLLPDRSA